MVNTRLVPLVVVVWVCVALLLAQDVEAKKRPSRAAAASSHRGGPRKAATKSRRRYEEDDDDEDVFLDDDDFGLPFEEDEEEERAPRSRRPTKSKPSKGSSASKRRYRYEEEEDEEDEEDFFLDDDDEDEEEEDEMPPPRRSKPKSKYSSSSRSRRPPKKTSRSSASRRSSAGRRGSRSNNSVVPYGDSRRGRQPPSSAVTSFTRGLTALRNSMPDPSIVREGVVSSISAARETTSVLSSNLYREVKGLTSSELEQVMLKATRPDDTPVKGKHVERLVGVTYQISSRYDIYDAVLRKLWGKMAEKDWRTTIKALYILHRFSADGAPDHAPALKARLRELRRTKDPKRKDKYFNSKQLLAGDAKPDNIKYRAFMSRYAHYVLLRAQCFGGSFDEIAQKPSAASAAASKKGAGKSKKAAAPAAVDKPITSTNLRAEHLEAAAMLLKAGVACHLKDGEDCENTAIAAERVAADLIALTTAVALAVNRALKTPTKDLDAPLMQRWCEFYRDDLLPQSRSMVKKTSEKLDAYGLFLPSRMGASIAPDVLEKGLSLNQDEGDDQETKEPQESSSTPEESKEAAPSESSVKQVKEEEDDEDEEDKEEPVDMEEDEDDEDEEEEEEYEYEEEEYYDDEEE